MGLTDNSGQPSPEHGEQNGLSSYHTIAVTRFGPLRIYRMRLHSDHPPANLKPRVRTINVCLRMFVVGVSSPLDVPNDSDVVYDRPRCSPRTTRKPHHEPSRAVRNVSVDSPRSNLATGGDDDAVSDCYAGLSVGDEGHRDREEDLAGIHNFGRKLARFSR